MIATLTEQEEVLKRIAKKIDRTEESVLRRALTLYETVIDDLKKTPENRLVLLPSSYVNMYARKIYTDIF